MLINSLSPKEFKNWKEHYPTAARQLDVLKRQAPHLRTIWATRDQTVYNHMYIECAIRIGDFLSLDPVQIAIEVCRELEPEHDFLNVMKIDYNAHVIHAANTKIHWISDQDESNCANMLAQLPQDATLNQIKAAFRLPFSQDDEWKESRPSSTQIIKRWIVSGTNYQVLISPNRSHPLLQNHAGYWVHPDWLTLSETAAFLGYQKTSSLRVAIHQGRLSSTKVGNTHLIRPTDIQTAIQEGRLKPPQSPF